MAEDDDIKRMDEFFNTVSYDKKADWEGEDMSEYYGEPDDEGENEDGTPIETRSKK